MFLSEADFRQVVGMAPLVSIDLVVTNSVGEVLLGMRRNRPARGYWFVPGGRVQKNESLDVAFLRLTQAELGRGFSRDDASLLGVCEHFYGDSVFGHEPDTHYVVLAYQLNAPSDLQELPGSQHQTFAWFDPDQASGNLEIHTYTRAYLCDLGRIR